MIGIGDILVTPLGHVPDDGWRTQAAVFEEIFLVFLVLGTAVGIVVVSYMLYNAYKYREGAADPDDSFETPTLGELPTGGAGGRKLFLSFGISAVIVIGLVAWTYTALLYVETGPAEDPEDRFEIHVDGFQFGWEFEYPNGHTEFNELRVPQGEVIHLTVTSNDVWHTFGSSELRIKVDAIPGQTGETWFVGDEQGTYLVECFELCGTGHSGMLADIVVEDPDEFEEWYAETGENGDEADDDDDDGEDANSDDEEMDDDNENAAIAIAP